MDSSEYIYIYIYDMEALTVDVTFRYKFTNQLLNKRNEQIFKCRHKNRFKLMIKVNNNKIDSDNDKSN